MTRGALQHPTRDFSAISSRLVYCGNDVFLCVVYSMLQWWTKGLTLFQREIVDWLAALATINL